MATETGSITFNLKSGQVWSAILGKSALMAVPKLDLTLYFPDVTHLTQLGQTLCAFIGDFQPAREYLEATSAKLKNENYEVDVTRLGSLNIHGNHTVISQERIWPIG